MKMEKIEAIVFAIVCAAALVVVYQDLLAWRPH